MARIRSIHPGLWTDERFMAVTPLARLLWVGILTECDDKGSFEWSPIKLKARLLPVDNCDINELMAELVSAGSIQRYELNGRQLGAVRNFTRFQRPQKPNSQYPQTVEVRNYCAGEVPEVPNPSPTGTGNGICECDEVPNQCPTGTVLRTAGDGEVPYQYATGRVIAPQMEEGGGRRKEEDKKEQGGGDENVPAEPYAFEGETIKLCTKDLEIWRKRFHAIPDIEAELAALDGWLTRQQVEKRKGWFHSVPSMINRKHQELLTAEKHAARSGSELELPIA